MKFQLLSDLHLDSESFDPVPAPEAECLVLAGDIDSTWRGFERFGGWPVPVIVVAGNHEFDGRDIDTAFTQLRALCSGFGFRFLERDEAVLTSRAGLRVRVLGTTRWSDFDLFGPTRRAKAERAAGYFLSQMGSTRGGRPFDAAAIRAEALACRAWLETALQTPASGRWDRTLVVTHFGPSLKSGDPRYGTQNGTASFCNADDDLIPRADLWVHGHVHCRHDYRINRPGMAPARVVCNPRGLAGKGETEGHDPLITLAP